MAGTVNITISRVSDLRPDKGRLLQALISWECDASASTITDQDFSDEDAAKLKGKDCILAITEPDGDDTPTDQYDIEIKDQYGIDVFGGALNDRSNAAAEQAVPLLDGAAHYGPRVCAGKWTFSLSNNSVNAAKGVCILYFR